MGAHAFAIPATDERRTRRVPLRGQFEFRSGDDETGKAEWRGLSRNGACIQTGRYLRPGREIRIISHGLELDARVVWSRAKEDGERFIAGLTLINKTPEASLLMLTAIVQRFVA